MVNGTAWSRCGAPSTEVNLKKDSVGRGRSTAEESLVGYQAFSYSDGIVNPIGAARPVPFEETCTRQPRWREQVARVVLRFTTDNVAVPATDQLLRHHRRRLSGAFL